jgi:ketosteroid isomerase-like protein
LHIIDAMWDELYADFNARDIDALLARMTPDVDWPNGWEGGREHGPEAVRAYWERQFREIDPHVEPVGVDERPDGTVVLACSDGFAPVDFSDLVVRLQLAP